MDRLIYLAMTGAKYLLARQDTLAHNLANASTPGFRAETTAFRSAPVSGIGLATRVFAVESTPRADFSAGVITRTGRDLDVALSGRAWLAVQGHDGREGYTRAGSLRVDETGLLVTAGGLPVLSDSGPIAIPPDHRVTIAEDGTVTASPLQPPLKSASAVGRIKLVSPPETALAREADGLFRLRGGGSAEPDAQARLVPGALESSNVNVAEAMIGMIAAARQFDMHMKLLQNAEGNARAGTQLLSVSA